MKYLLFAIILSFTLCYNPIDQTSKLNGFPNATIISRYYGRKCNETINEFKLHIYAMLIGFTRDIHFEIPLTQPSNMSVNCTICDMSKTYDDCLYITCTIDTKKYPLKNANIELPETFSGLQYGFNVYDWDKYITPYRMVEENYNCLPHNDFSGYIKVGAMLLVGLFLL